MRPAGRTSQLHMLFTGLPVYPVLLTGLALLLCQWFPTEGLPWWGLALVLLAVTALLWLGQLLGLGKGVFWMGLLLLLAVCLVLSRQMLGGFGELANQLLEQATVYTGRIFLDLSSAQPAAASLALGALGALCVLLLHQSIWSGKMVYAVPVFLPVFLAGITGFWPLGPGGGLLLLGLVLLAVRRGALTGQWLAGLRGLPSYLLVVALCLLLAAACGAAFFDRNDSDAMERLEQKVHTLRHDKDSNSMPEGQLRNLSRWNKNQTPALELTMTEPQKMYLRGRIYETYTGTQWKPLPSEERAEYEDLFYWLHQWDFYGQSQIGTASAFIPEAKTEQLTVLNHSACTGSGYYPYALAGNETLPGDRIGDTALPEAQTLHYYPGSVPEWYEIQQTLASAQGRSGIARYLAAETAYEEYLMGVDLQMTNESWSALERVMEQEEAPRTLAQIREGIRTWLEENMTYDETVKTRSGGNDFLQYTLEQSGSGYSVHYATAATLMLRYFGVPARYVEGYFLSAEEAAGYGPGEPIILTEAHAHAWAEYYLPGVGFVPFEVTPGYMDDEESRLGGSAWRNENTYTGDHLQYARVERPEKIEDPEQDRFSFSMKPAYLLYLSGLLLLALALVVFLKRRKLNAALTGIEKAPHREAIALRYGYAMALQCRSKAPPHADAAAAAELNREARFSTHEMTAEQRQWMDCHARSVLQNCKNSWSWFQKVKYRLWNCLY